MSDEDAGIQRLRVAVEGRDAAVKLLADRIRLFKDVAGSAHQLAEGLAMDANTVGRWASGRGVPLARAKSSTAAAFDEWAARVSASRSRRYDPVRQLKGTCVQLYDQCFKSQTEAAAIATEIGVSLPEPPLLSVDTGETVETSPFPVSGDGVTDAQPAAPEVTPAPDGDGDGPSSEPSVATSGADADTDVDEASADPASEPAYSPDTDPQEPPREPSIQGRWIGAGAVGGGLVLVVVLVAVVLWLVVRPGSGTDTNSVGATPSTAPLPVTTSPTSPTSPTSAPSIPVAASVVLNKTNLCTWQLGSHPIPAVSLDPPVLRIDARCNNPKHADPDKDPGVTVFSVPSNNDAKYKVGVVRDGHTVVPVCIQAHGEEVGDLADPPNSSKIWVKIKNPVGLIPDVNIGGGYSVAQFEVMGVGPCE